MEIYSVLEKDHRQFKAILKKLEKSTERAVALRDVLLAQLKYELVAHARAEEKVLYEPLKLSDVKKADDLAFEGYEEHHVVDRLFEEFAVTDPSDKRYTALISVLKESLEHHIKEEENDTFAKAKKSFTSEEAREMAEEFKTLKSQYQKKADRKPKARKAAKTTKSKKKVLVGNKKTRASAAQEASLIAN